MSSSSSSYGSCGASKDLLRRPICAAGGGRGRWSCSAAARRQTSPLRPAFTSFTRLAAFGERGQEEEPAPPQRLPAAPEQAAAGALPDATVELIEDGTLVVKQQQLLPPGDGDGDGNGNGNGNGNGESGVAVESLLFFAEAWGKQQQEEEGDGAAATEPPTSDSPPEVEQAPRQQKKPSEPALAIFALVSIVADAIHDLAKDLSAAAGGPPGQGRGPPLISGTTTGFRLDGTAGKTPSAEEAAPEQRAAAAGGGGVKGGVGKLAADLRRAVRKVLLNKE